MKNIILFLLITVSARVFAQAPTAVQAPADLKSLVKRSLSYFPKLKEADQQLQLAQENVVLTQTNKMPVLSASGSYSYVAPVSQPQFPGGPNGEVLKVSFQPNNNISTGLNASYTVLDFGRLNANILRSKSNYTLAGTQKAAGELTLAAQVAQAYYGLAYLSRSISLQDTLIRLYGEDLRLTESRLRNGTALLLDKLTIQANMEAELNRRADLVNQFRRQQLSLAYASGDSVSQLPAGFDFTTQPLNTAAALDLAVQRHPDFTGQRERINVAKQDVHIAGLARYPLLTANAQGGFRNGYIIGERPNVNKLYGNYSAGAALAIPIYSGNKLKQQVKLGKVQQQIAESGVETMRNQYRRDIAQALEDARSARERLGTTEAQVTLAREAMRQANNRYRAGITTHLEITQAAATLQRAVLQQLNFQYQYTLSQIELARLTGERFWE